MLKWMNPGWIWLLPQLLQRGDREGMEGSRGRGKYCLKVSSVLLNTSDFPSFTPPNQIKSGCNEGHKLCRAGRMRRLNTYTILTLIHTHPLTFGRRGPASAGSDDSRDSTSWSSKSLKPKKEWKKEPSPSRRARSAISRTEASALPRLQRGLSWGT